MPSTWRLPDPEGLGASRAISIALANAGASASDVVHINAHATSTPVGDVAESPRFTAHRIIGRFNCGQRYQGVNGAPARSSGSSRSRLQRACPQGRHRSPTRNLDSQDDEVHLDVVRVEGRHINGEGIALSTSFGFGGHNVALAFRGDRG